MENKKIDFTIVQELPQVPIRNYKDEEGKEYEIITLTEAVKEMLGSIRELKEALIGKK